MKITIEVDDKALEQFLKRTKTVKRSHAYALLFNSAMNKFLEVTSESSMYEAADILVRLPENISIGGGK